MPPFRPGHPLQSDGAGVRIQQRRRQHDLPCALLAGGRGPGAHVRRLPEQGWGRPEAVPAGLQRQRPAARDYPSRCPWSAPPCGVPPVGPGHPQLPGPTMPPWRLGVHLRFVCADARHRPARLPAGRVCPLPHANWGGPQEVHGSLERPAAPPACYVPQPRRQHNTSKPHRSQRRRPHAAHAHRRQPTAWPPQHWRPRARRLHHHHRIPHPEHANPVPPSVLPRTTPHRFTMRGRCRVPGSGMEGAARLGDDAGAR
mmetsp:Transcript_98966/g.170411  ORF Transcript_98966/g.170411 Transcript_98966/m.170411 type:complete len:256 (-) Transcript_98966:919-1686(-)